MSPSPKRVLARFLEAGRVREHLRERGLNADETPDLVVIDEDAGVATFLLYDLSGNLIGFQQYRPDAPKKVTGPEGRYWPVITDRGGANKLNVWGLHTLTPRVKTLYIVEGIFDAVKLHRQGLAAIAMLGNSGTPGMRDWLKILPQRIVAVLDNDAAGRNLARFSDHYVTVPDPYKDLGEMPDDEVRAFLREKKLIR